MPYSQNAAYVKLRNGEVVNVEGVDFVIDGDGTVRKGDSYIAERNTGPKLLTAQEIDNELGCIFPTTLEYPYDINECVKVKMVD